MVLQLSHDTFDSCVTAAIDTLTKGGIFVFPTETVYGLGCSATNAQAVSKVLEYKQRPAGRSIPVVVANKAMAETIVQLTPSAQKLYDTFLPGPLTVISKSEGIVDHRLESELGTLGVRISSHEFVQAVVEGFGGPIVATSASVAGGARVYSIAQVEDQLRPEQFELVDLIIDAGTLLPNPPSSVVDTTQDAQELVRAGIDPSQYGAVMHSGSEGETAEIAARLLAERAEELSSGPLVFALEGEMGAGKTHFAKGLATALQVNDVVSSPTYTLIKEYEGQWNGQPVHLVHMDLWRTPTITAEELVLSDYLKSNTVVAIEWANPLLTSLAEQQLPGYKILFSGDGDIRTLSVAKL